MILADFRWIGPHGIGRFAQEMIKRLDGVQELEDGLKPTHPFDVVWSSLKISRIKPSPKVYFTPGYTPPLWCTIPFVFTICDLNHIDVPENSGVLKQSYYQYIMRPACHQAFRVLTISEFSRQRIIEWSGLHPDRVINVSLGVDKHFRPDGAMYKPGFPYLLHIGNHKSHKNVGRLLEAFRYSNLSDDLKLILSGNPDPHLVSLCRQWDLGRSVVFAGLIPDADLPTLYRGARALVFPSLYEGFGLPPLEAMACGTPVITSNTTSLPEVVGDAGLLVNPMDVEEIAHAIQSLAQNNVLREQLREKGLQRAKLFSWEKTAALTRQVLQDAAGQN